MSDNDIKLKQALEKLEGREIPLEELERYKQLGFRYCPRPLYSKLLYWFDRKGYAIFPLAVIVGLYLSQDYLPPVVQSIFAKAFGLTFSWFALTIMGVTMGIGLFLQLLLHRKKGSK